MISIKRSFANCSVCPLLESSSCILETNCEDDISKVDVVFVAENPGKQEVKTGIPLIGKSGKTFRKYFNKYGIDKLNYLLTNVVLCQTLNDDGTTGNPEDDVIERCKVNCMSIIKACNPKLVVLMGGSPMSAFGVAKAGITNIHGRMTDWEGFKTIVIVHPSFVNRNLSVWETKFENALQDIADILKGKKITEHHSAEIKSVGNGIHRYKIPEQFYTNKFRLIDVQFLTKTRTVLYIFRDEYNNKIFHKETDEYFCYQIPEGVPAKKIVPYEQLKQVSIKYKDRYDLDPEITYEGDVKITSKHAMDYYHFNQGECPKTKSNIMFFDIEIDTGDERVFPQPKEARFPINMLTTILNGVTTCYVVDNKTEPLKKMEGVNYKIFDNEKMFLHAFIKDYKKSEPDFMAGWNCIAEDEYVYLNNRIVKIDDVGIGDKLSLFGNIENKRCSGLKDAYKIKLKNGTEIVTSDNHIFPYYKKEKEKYYTKDKLIQNFNESKLKHIIKDMNKHDLFFKIDRHINNNTIYTWGEYLFENIEKILKFKEFDICMSMPDIKERIKDIAPHLIPLKDYWYGKNYYKNKYWSYKNLKDFISIEDVKIQLKTLSKQIFRINTSFVEIDLNEEININDIQMMGFEYTDGFWSTYSNEHCFDNKDKECCEYYCSVFQNKYCKEKFDLNKKWNKRDSLYTFSFGYINKYTLLMPFIYNINRKKELDISILSRLSYLQMSSFISGVIDGDGSVHEKEIRICNFEDGGPKKFYNLLNMNGVFSFLNKNGVTISYEYNNKKFINSLNIQHGERKRYFDNRVFFKRKNSCSNNISHVYDINYTLSRIISIEKTNTKINMIDLETSSGYFSCNSIKTHNCISFDLEYIFNRLPQIGLSQEMFTKFKEFYVDGDKYVCNIPGSVAIDQDFLYKLFTFTKMENYKLGFIAAHELEGYTKLDLPLPFNEMYWKMFNLTVEYNIRDTVLLEKLDDKLAHINLLNELRVICNTSFDSVSSFGQIDSLIVSYLKNKGFASKNANPHIKKSKYPGAYVHQPVPGSYNWITDFDFKSLYPSIMITYNIGVNSYVMKLKKPELGYELAYHPDKLPDKIEVFVDPLYENKLMTCTRDQLLNKIKEKNLVTTINGCFFKPHKEELSIFGEIVDMLMVSRTEYKDQMFAAKNKDDESFFYTRQLVYKVLANTLYGIVAMKAFRFFDVSLAAAITLSGQEALKTSIIEGDAFMRYLDTCKPYVSPKQLTKKEMYSEEMPDRGNEYIVTGDTDSIFCMFGNFNHELSISKIHDWCAKIETFLNDDKIAAIAKRHYVDMDYNRLKLKNELVISRGLFLAKKRYAIRVINNEGKDVDKINYMGVEIKRSDYPRKSKEFLSELTELILKSEKFKLSKTIQYVTRKEREFKELILNGDKSIARPVSYGKELKDYKVIPQGVRAMESWNKIMYDIHKRGNKAYMYWVRGIDFDKIRDVKEREEIRAKYEKFIGEGNKFEVIAIPDEEKRLPSFFVPDLKAALKFSFEDRHQLMLKPLTDVRQVMDVLTV